MHTATNYYLFSLAVSDLLLLVLGIPQELFSLWQSNTLLLLDTETNAQTNAQTNAHKNSPIPFLFITTKNHIKTFSSFPPRIPLHFGRILVRPARLRLRNLY